jgi:hypothetical protein
MAHSTRSRFGSACGLYCSILFIVAVYKGLLFVKQTPDGSRSACSGRFRSFTIALRIPSHPALRIAGARRSQIKDRKQKISNLEVPAVPGHSDPVRSKVHTLLRPNYTFIICSWQDQPVEKSLSHY